MKEFEVRLFDDAGSLFLLVPVIAGDAQQAADRAEMIRRSNQAARHELRGQMRSARYDAGKDAPA